MSEISSHPPSPARAADDAVRALWQALLANVDDAQLAELAELLRPHLREQQPSAEGWLRGAEAIGAYIGAPRSRVYALVSAGRLPVVQHEGSALVARRADLDRFVEAGGAKRP